jgi:hypothetical protein
MQKLNPYYPFRVIGARAFSVRERYINILSFVAASEKPLQKVFFFLIKKCSCIISPLKERWGSLVLLSLSYEKLYKKLLPLAG